MKKANYFKLVLIKVFKYIFGQSSKDVSRLISFRIKRKKKSYFGLNGLDKKLEKYVDYENGFYVELGANDGINQSNSLFFELHKNWHGVLVEPSVHNYLLCKKYRSEKNHIFCNACVDFDFKDKYVEMKYANLMTISNNLDLDIINMDKHIKNVDKHLEKNQPIFDFGARAATLTSLLNISNAPKMIDFISLDVEGAELSVLKGIDFSKYNFKFMLIEIRNFERVNSFLERHNYIFLETFSKHDYLFKYNSVVNS